MDTMNGRVSDIFDPSSSRFQYEEESVEDRQTFDDEMQKGLRASTEVSKLFFSSINIDALQHGIRYGVYKRTNGKHVIGNQSINELKVIMRSIYMKNSENLPYNVVEQVRELNTLVLNYAIPTIVKELDQYATYRRDQSSLPIPMERSQATTIKGSKPSEFKNFM